MSAPSVFLNYLSENPTLASKTRHSEMPDDSDSPEVEYSDVKCFEALPDDTVEAIGSMGSAIRKIIRENQETVDVVKYLRFAYVPPAVADKFFLRGAPQMFNCSTRYMIIKLVTEAHETALHSLAFEVQTEIRNMGMGQSFFPLGATKFAGTSCKKQADLSYRPRQPVPGRNSKWPTVVVEVGVSESHRKLRADAEWWLANSRGDVKLIVIVSISRTPPNIMFEAITLDPTANLTLRLQQPRYVPHVRQTITVSRIANNPNSATTITPAVPFTIRFEELFCRQPVPPEHDIQLSLNQLRMISDLVWEVQGF